MVPSPATSMLGSKTEPPSLTWRLDRTRSSVGAWSGCARSGGGDGDDVRQPEQSRARRTRAGAARAIGGNWPKSGIGVVDTTAGRNPGRRPPPAQVATMVARDGDKVVQRWP